MTTTREVPPSLRPGHPGPAIERLGGSSFHVVRSWDLVAEVAARAEDFSSNLTATMVIDESGGISEFPVAELGSPVHALATADGEVHRIHRTLVLPSLTPRTLRSWAPFVTSTLRRLWTQRYDNGIDWVSDVAERLPAAVIAELIGVRQELSDDLLDWAFASTAILDGVVAREELDSAVGVVGQFMAFLDDELHRARGARPGAVIGDLARLVEDGSLPHDVAIQVLLQLIVAGIESTVGHLGSLASRLGQHPEHLERLRSDPASRDAFTEEVLRLDAPFVGHYRHVVRDTELGGVTIRAGAHLFLLWGSANRDPNHFAEPDRFDPTRDDASHLSFGRGIHFCVGAALARLESRAALDLLLDHAPDLHIHTDTASWQPSMLVRRLRSLRITV
ncbi:cytochrome P450 [Dietzia sp. DQ12-76]|nr:cytochrome P450 [Dietzia sp. DQ11-38-2]MBB1023214.1 cytochrome P450 [Dietzia sp. DQ12-76]MBB1029092.1 cytochrome P450 [Dietzia sp. DQ11-38-2]